MTTVFTRAGEGDGEDEGGAKPERAQGGAGQKALLHP